MVVVLAVEKKMSHAHAITTRDGLAKDSMNGCRIDQTISTVRINERSIKKGKSVGLRGKYIIFMFEI